MPMMNDGKKSDPAIIAKKPSNEAVQAVEELVEPRAGTDGNPGDRHTDQTLSWAPVFQSIERIRQFFKRKPRERLTALLHHITPLALGEAYLALRRDAAPGVDGVTWRVYATGLDERLLDLHRRVHSGAYRATPVRRVNIPKPDGGTRPLGIAALEDKIVQRAVVDVLLTPFTRRLSWVSAMDSDRRAGRMMRSMPWPTASNGARCTGSWMRISAASSMRSPEAG